MARRFTGSFPHTGPTPADTNYGAVAVLQSERLHRRNLADDVVDEVAQPRAEYRDWQGNQYCRAATSGRQALQIALRASGLRAVEANPKGHPGVTTIHVPAEARHSGSSLRFRMPDFTATRWRAFLDAAKARGVELKCFGAAKPVGFTSTHPARHHVTARDLPRTDRIPATLFNTRLPPGICRPDCTLIAGVIGDATNEVAP